MSGLLIISNREITKITVHSYRGGAFYRGSVADDAETELGSGKCERANLDSWLRHNRQRMIGQREREAFSSGDRNFQDSTRDFETITTDELLSDGIGFSGREASPNRLLPLH